MAYRASSRGGFRGAGAGAGARRGGGSSFPYFRGRGGGGGGKGGGGGGRGGGGGGGQVAEGKSWEDLLRTLRGIDGGSYGAYNQLYGSYQHVNPAFRLAVDHVQGDSYAPPSRVRAIMPLDVTGFPDKFLATPTRRIALADYLTRTAASIIRENAFDKAMSGGGGGGGGGWHQPKGGDFTINAPGQAVLQRSSCIVHTKQTPPNVELRFTVNLPARGRTILGDVAARILTQHLPSLVAQTLLYSSHPPASVLHHIRTVEDQEALRAQLPAHNLVAFVADGAILPRASGASSAPMTDPADLVPFQSPPELRVELVAPNAGPITGMGIPTGVTVLTGGGFHGKSTLLAALAHGVYNHLPGDGRERVVTVPTAVAIRAEDGRSVTGVDISPFVRGATLPGRRPPNPAAFTTADASGSTSMAANIQEALEAGASALLIDEDTSATNLLVRDARMRALLDNSDADGEPLIPLADHARTLHRDRGVSTVLVVGGLGDWLALADTVVGMHAYAAHDLTARARAVVRAFPTLSPSPDLPTTYPPPPRRVIRLDPAVVDAGKGPFARGRGFIAFGAGAAAKGEGEGDAPPGVDVGALAQLVETGQTRALALGLQLLARAPAERPLAEVVGELEGRIAEDEDGGGLDVLDVTGGRFWGDLVAPRRFEMLAAVSRVRGAGVRVLGREEGV